MLVVGKTRADEDRLDVDEEEQPQAATAIVAAHRSTEVAFTRHFLEIIQSSPERSLAVNDAGHAACRYRR